MVNCEECTKHFIKFFSETAVGKPKRRSAF